MKRQVEMQESMIRVHRDFMAGLEKSLAMLEQEINEAEEMAGICTDEWCLSVEGVLDEAAKMIFSISEPRWLGKEDSARLATIRRRVHDIYARYKSVGNR